MRHIISKLCNISEKSYYVWKNKTHVNLIALIEKYFSKEDLEEFLSIGKISKFELLKEKDSILQYAGVQYINIFKKRLISIGDIINKDFMDIYFNVLVIAKKDISKQSVFKPFSISKSIMIYLLKHNTSYKQKNNELMPKLETGFERLDEFDCYTNQFLFSNILQNFEPMIQIAESGLLDKNEKAEAYLHAILFHLYDKHQNKTIKQKREIFFDIFITMLQANDKNNLTNIALNEDSISLDTLIRSNLALVEKNYKIIIKSLAKK